MPQMWVRCSRACATERRPLRSMRQVLPNSSRSATSMTASATPVPRRAVGVEAAALVMVVAVVRRRLAVGDVALRVTAGGRVPSPLLQFVLRDPVPLQRVALAHAAVLHRRGAAGLGAVEHRHLLDQRLAVAEREHQHVGAVGLLATVALGPVVPGDRRGDDVAGHDDLAAAAIERQPAAHDHAVGPALGASGAAPRRGRRPLPSRGAHGCGDDGTTGDRRRRRGSRAPSYGGP